MAHYRPRLIDDLYKKLLAFSPLIGVFGHRQVGKSTFVSAKTNEYYTLDDETVLARIRASPKKFIAKICKYPTALDECQLAPALFPALKERVRTNKRPGQIVLTGSVRFTSRKAIRESLAGRIVSIELYPLTVAELAKSLLNDLVPRLVKVPTFSGQILDFFPQRIELNKMKREYQKYLENGGLPGLCFIRNQRLQRAALDDVHHLIIDRDIRMIADTRLSQENLYKYLRLIATNTFGVYNASEVKRRMGLSHQTQKQLLYALESIFMIRRIPIKPRSGEIILLEDQLEERVLTTESLSRSVQMMTAFYRNVRAQFSYQLGLRTTYESYWTKSGARVPLVIRNEEGVLGVLGIEGTQPSLIQKRAADSFLRRERAGKIVYISEDIEKPCILDERSLLSPVASLV